MNTDQAAELLAERVTALVCFRRRVYIYTDTGTAYRRSADRWVPVRIIPPTVRALLQDQLDINHETAQYVGLAQTADGTWYGCLPDGSLGTRPLS